jgi:ABC-type multidrug transport system ATPase subunit
VVNEVMEALVKLRGKVAMIVVEHHAETVLTIVDKAYLLVNGAVAFEGEAAKLAEDHALQATLLFKTKSQPRSRERQSRKKGKESKNGFSSHRHHRPRHDRQNSLEGYPGIAADNADRGC